MDQEVKSLLPKFYKFLLYKNNNTKFNFKDIKLYKNFKKDKNFLKYVKNIKDYNLKKVEEYNKLEEKHGFNNIQKLNSIKILDPISYININSKIYGDKYNEKVVFTNAFRKMYEVCVKTNFIPKNKSIIKHFDICGFPGAFIYGLNHYIKTKLKDVNYDWYIQSYVIGKNQREYFIDEFGLIKKYGDKFLIGGENGDITKTDTILSYYEFFKNNKRDIVTSDCGLQMEPGGDREKLMLNIFLGQFICGIGVLKKGGNFFMKGYHMSSNFSISLIYLMTLLFKEVLLVKPESSRQISGEEIYLLLLDYKLGDRESKNVFYQLTKLLSEDIDMTSSLISYTKIDKGVLSNIYKELSSFYKIKLNLKVKKKSFMNKYINFDTDDEIIKTQKKELKRKTDFYVKKYTKNYFKRMNYYKIKNKDKL